MTKFELRTGEDIFNLTAEDVSSLDIISAGEGKYHILHEGKSIHAELIHEDRNDKTISLLINGTRYDFSVEDTLDRLIRDMGYAEKKSQRFSELVSPMPGLILEIMVKEGESVSEGDPMLILEAMKMENVLKAPGDGVIKKICLKKGDPVDKNQVIIEME